MDLTQQITKAFELEQQNKRKAVNADDIPVSYDAIAPQWLTNVICKNHPGAEVLAYRLDAPDDGTTDRQRIFLTYNEAGNVAKLPPSLFCKASHRLDKRLMLAKEAQASILARGMTGQAMAANHEKIYQRILKSRE